MRLVTMLTPGFADTARGYVESSPVATPGLQKAPALVIKGCNVITLRSHQAQ